MGDPRPIKKPSRIQLRNRRRILDAALDTFSQFGFRGTTLDQIAKAAGLSKPNLIYYFDGKEAIHAALLSELLETWLDPLKELDAGGEPMEEILAYVRRKLRLSQDFPRESRLFATEIIQGAPHIQRVLETDLKTLVDKQARIIQGWMNDGRLAPADPYHLIFSIWSLTQHYADFDTQVRAVLATEDAFPAAEAYLETLFTRLLKV
ncbi:TetR family transcriptional regulator C-terminal domain-containing protein [Mesobacterium pallidum]|uniref:TetR family transcriptional regulator C-terminal domain-containing protein n=1 Tax=Mesobacterium pallidum TaxID=2872037 RepID=UPI001EE1EEA9|nr:TetR family transcriptional regulator C-terminal domain-containing protein [Mesobacterium pallidum]